MNYLFSKRQPYRLLSIFVQWLLVFWVAGLVLYFEYREGLINWQWLQKPADGGWFASHNLPDPRFAPSGRAGGFQVVLNHLSSSWDIHWSNIPFGPLIFSMLMVGAYTMLGWMLLGSFELYLPRLARVCLGLVTGCAVVGVAMELICMAGMLTQPTVILMWLILFAAAYWLRARHREDWTIPHRTPDGSRLSPAARQDIATDWFRTVHPMPLTIPGKIYFGIACLLIATISFVLLLHAIGQPETYWDSLILYMGYAKLMYLEGAFPEKVVGQVGIGLGANYPHLYSLLTAQTAAFAGNWHDIYAQLLPPVAGLVSTLLVFYTALELSRDRLIAVSAALLFRAVPYGLSYTQYASDYAIAIMFTAAFLYVALKYLLDGHPSYRWLLLGFAAAAVHINYLMWVLWPVAVVVILIAHFSRRIPPEEEFETNPDIYDVLDTNRPLELKAPRFLSLRERYGVAQLLRSSEFWISTSVLFILALPWYIRNTIVTGNPVYAFYSNVFVTSKRVNPEVMRSAEQEWLLNGDGLGRAGRSLIEKLANSWEYFVTGHQHWKLAPVFVAFVIPGFLLAAAGTIVRFLMRRGGTLSKEDNYGVGAQARYVLPTAMLFLGLWFYAYVVADFYLYQIIIVLPLFGIFACYLFQVCDSRPVRIILYSITLLVGFAPGFIMSLMGFKLKNTGVYEGMAPPQMSLTALRKLWMDRDIFYRMEFGGDMEMFGKVNLFDPGTVLLTHENRHLLLDPGIKILHLDDWEVQQTYRKPVEERIRILDELGVQYYLYVPNEDKHVINSLVGMDELIELGYFRGDYTTKSSGHSIPELVEHTVIPRDQNVLYKRTTKP